MNKAAITYNTTEKLVVQSRVEGTAICDLDELHKRVEHEFLERLIGLRRGEDVEERFEGLVELGAEPGVVDDLRFVGGGGGGCGGGGSRKLREEREEEGVERKERFENMVRR